MVIGKILKKIVKIVNRIRLKNHGFIILCNSCIGGVIYSKLGEQFDSPTINMSMSDKEFLRFIHNMDYYLSFDLCPCKNDSHTQYNALIGDLHCFFGHYSSWNEVVEKWEIRKKRIHKDNLFIIMSDRPSGGIETEIRMKICCR